MPLPRTPAPDLSFPLIAGGDWSLTDSKPENFTIVVFYRGTHCPICKNFLAEIEEQIETARAQGVEIVAISMDGADRTKKTVDEKGLSKLPVGHSMSEATARAWDLYISSAREGSTEPGVFSEPGLFVIDPAGMVFFAQTQSAPFTRPNITKLLAGLKFVIEKNYPARGDLTAA